jgi:hypothetical protein
MLRNTLKKMFIPKKKESSKKISLSHAEVKSFLRSLPSDEEQRSKNNFIKELIRADRTNVLREIALGKFLSEPDPNTYESALSNETAWVTICWLKNKKIPSCGEVPSDDHLVEN